MVLEVGSFKKAFAITLLFLSLPSAFGIQDPEGLRVCFLEDNLPYSDRLKEIGFDYELGKILAESLDRDFVPVWVANSTQIQEIETDYPFRRLARGDCSLVLSVPGPVKSIAGENATITLGKAYYGAAFEIVARDDNLSSNLYHLRNKDVAILSQTVAHFALRMIGGRAKTYFSVREAISGLLAGEAQAGLLWGPTAGWNISHLGGIQSSVRFVEEYTPSSALRWNIHFATRQTDEILRAQIADALSLVISSGRLDELLMSYHFPVRRPFESTHTSEALNNL